MKVCAVEGCERKHYARGLCRMDYRRVRRNGTTDRLRAPKGSGTINVHGYRQIGVNGKQVLEHRLVMGCTPNDGMHVHHIDGDKLNNDPANLQVMTATEHKRLHDFA